MAAYYVGRWHDERGRCGIAVVREDDAPPFTGRDQLPPNMLEVVPLLARSQREAREFFLVHILKYSPLEEASPLLHLDLRGVAR